MPGRVLTPQECYTLINAIAEEVTGQQPTIQAVNTSTFVSVGETILRAGTENTLNAIALVLGRTYMAVRPYNAKLKIINAIDSDLYANRMRKISFYSRKAQASGAFNTNLYTNHAMGYDNNSNGGASVASMWEQNTPVPLELNFGGRSVWDDSTTIYEDQLQVAFKDPAEFGAFMGGIMTEKGNDVEVEKEAFNRATMLNYMAGIYDLNSVNGAAIDLTAGFNAANGGTTYTRTQLLTTYFKEFLEYFVATLKKLSNDLEYRSVKYHWSPTKTINGVSYELLRHTPKSEQRLLLFRPFYIDAEAKIMPEIFNDKYLKIENFEGVDFWQNSNAPEAINVTPAIPDTSDPTTQIAGTAVALDYVLGVLYDKDAMMVDYQLDSANSTPVEARKRYRNIWFHFARNAINDFTENGILLYMG